MKSGLYSTPKPDLSRDIDGFEIAWVEVENRNGKIELLCCTNYYPSPDPDSFR